MALTATQVYVEPDPNLGPIWADFNDDTFTSQWGDDGPSDVYDGSFPNYSGTLLTPHTGEPVTGLTVHLRASATRSDGLPDPVMAQYDLWGHSAGPGDDPTAGGLVAPYWGISSPDFPIVTDGVIRDYEWPLEDPSSAFATENPLDGISYGWADLTAGISLPTVLVEIYFDSWGGTAVEPGSPSINRTLSIYELRIELATEPEPTGKPFRRVWPREHGRVWPPPRHQHGRRTAGGYL